MSAHRKSVEWITNRFAVWSVRFVEARLTSLARLGETWDTKTTYDVAADMAERMADDLEHALLTRPWLQNTSFPSNPSRKVRSASCVVCRKNHLTTHNPQLTTHNPPTNMPLKKSPSKKAFGENVATERRAGKPRDQALAIAYRVKRQAAAKKRR